MSFDYSSLMSSGGGGGGSTRIAESRAEAGVDYGSNYGNRNNPWPVAIVGAVLGLALIFALFRKGK